MHSAYAAAPERPSAGAAPAFPAAAPVQELADIFGVLSDPNRLRLMIALLHRPELRVGELAAAAEMSESATSHALRLLRAHRVVQARRDGRSSWYRLADSHVRALLDLGLRHLEHLPRPVNGDPERP